MKDFLDYQEKIEAATILGGWDALSEISKNNLYDDTLPSDLNIQHQYISEYFKAYFREGKFYKVNIDVTVLQNKIIEKLKEKIPGLGSDQDYVNLASSLYPENFDAKKNSFEFGRINDNGFVTRGGKKFAFPGLEVTATAGDSDKTSISKIDYINIGSDLIRVLLHAIYDAKFQIPAVSKATGLNENLGINKLSVNQNRNVSEEEFERIETRATQVEGMTSAGIGRVIRGIAVLSLDNEAIATAIETAVGVAIRKQIEKVMWCWYECEFNEVDEVGDYAAISYGDPIEIVLSVSGDGKSLIK